MKIENVRLRRCASGFRTEFLAIVAKMFEPLRTRARRVFQRAPLVWTLHEMTAMTGGCPYAYDCPGFTRACGSCPQLGSSDPDDFSHQIWRRKKSIYARLGSRRLHIVAPSRWMADEARRSSLLGGFPVSVIPYGLDLETFRPRAEAKRLLEVVGLDAASRVILFLADYTANRRKGFALLDEALANIGDARGVALVSLGRDAPRLRSNLPHAHLGNISDDRLISAVYSMADVFVIPSLQDNLPNTVLESMACGTPVVGFRVGGVPDMVRDGENGILVAPADVAGLASAIASILRDDARRAQMGAAARTIAEKEYTLTLQAERYLTLYRSLTSSI
jgi:glycosyltransferase involved in cell wall biosynthesis